MPRLDRCNLSMKTLGDFRRFVKEMHRMYSKSISDELRRVARLGREDSDYARDLRRDLADFDERARQVFDEMGEVPDTTRLSGTALSRAKHMLLIGR